LTPERATEIQWALGADIAMAFDHVVPGGADGATARDALERTLSWLERCARRHAELKALADATTVPHKSSPGDDVQRSVVASANQTLWPILQGGAHLELRLEGLRRILDVGGRTGVAVGGVSGGEPEPGMSAVLAAVRRDVRLRGLHHVLARLPPAPVRRGGTAGAAAPVAAQCAVPDPARGRDAGGHPRGPVHMVGRRMAPPLHAIGNELTCTAQTRCRCSPPAAREPPRWAGSRSSSSPSLRSSTS